MPELSTIKITLSIVAVFLPISKVFAGDGNAIEIGGISVGAIIGLLVLWEEYKKKKHENRELELKNKEKELEMKQKYEKI
jgi:hypothetical protein